jgi:predicted RNA-binding protein with PUA-like domain
LRPALFSLWCVNQRPAGINASAGRLHVAPIHHSPFANSLLVLKHWLVKSEPEAYSWATFVQEDGTAWTGVRNYQARNNLNLMQPGDLVLFYHSVSEKAVVGLAEVAALAIPDATAEAGSPWVAVPLRPVQLLARPVGLAQLKADVRLGELALIRQSRLSVLPVRPEEFDAILELGAE